MSTEIYYFSSTGNSMVVAREIAERTGGTLISMSSTRDQGTIRSDADAIGLVFPVYYASLGGSGLPRIVEQFLTRLADIGDRYLFAVCTHSGGPGDTIENLDRLIRARGGELAVGFGVRTGVPYSPGAKIKHLLFQRELELDRAADEKKRQALFVDCAARLDALGRQVRARVKGEVERRGTLAKAAGTPWLLFQEQLALARYRALANTTSRSLDDLIPLADAAFETDERCTGCGTCARVCPVGNIELVEGRPVWRHGCETCYACFQWCPRQAVYGSIVEYEKRDHHPDVNLAAMLEQTSRQKTRTRQDVGGRDVIPEEER